MKCSICHQERHNRSNYLMHQISVIFMYLVALFSYYLYCWLFTFSNLHVQGQTSIQKSHSRKRKSSASIANEATSGAPSEPTTGAPNDLLLVQVNLLLMQVKVLLGPLHLSLSRGKKWGLLKEPNLLLQLQKASVQMMLLS